MSNIKTWKKRITAPLTNQINLFTSMQDEIDELRKKLSDFVPIWIQVVAERDALQAKLAALEKTAVTDDMKMAVRWAPSSAYWSTVLTDIFGPDARDGINALEKQLREQIAAAGAAPNAWKDAILDVMTIYGMDAPTTDAPEKIIKDLIELATRVAIDPTLAAGAAPVPEGWRSAVAMAYGHLWHVNNEPMAPTPLRSEESASYAARKLLRNLMTTKERGEAINAVQKLLAAAPKDAP